MTDNIDPQKRSWTMAQVHSTDTKPEMRVRKALHAAGFRFRLHRRDLPGCPDIVLPRYKTVVFVHGCFWHWHGCKRSRMPSSNTDYWRRKIAGNIERDKQSQEKLTQLGWRVVIVWECALEDGIATLTRQLLI
jgi:DNA mismatch endonuclease (patch repair protein)